MAHEPLTVRQLIIKLLEFDLNLPVEVCLRDDDCHPAHDIYRYSDRFVCNAWVTDCVIIESDEAANNEEA